MFRSSNPVLSRMDDSNIQMLSSAPMTVNGTIGKAFGLILIALVSAAAIVYVPRYCDSGNFRNIYRLFGYAVFIPCKSNKSH